MERNKLNHSVQLSRISQKCKSINLNNDRHSSRILLGSKCDYESTFHRRITTPRSQKLPLYNSCVINKSRVKNNNSSFFMPIKSTILANKSKDLTFLKNLYNKKATDLKTIRNNKHEKIFIDRLKDKISEDEFIAVQCDFGENSIQQICKYLIKKCIKKLALSKNPIGQNGIIYLSKTLPQLNLQQLQLISIGLTPKHSKQLFESIMHCKNLEILNISSMEGLHRNRIAKQTGVYLERVFVNPLCKITEISLQNVGMSQQCFGLLCRGIYNNKNCQLKVLNISKNDLKEGSMKIFADKLKNVALQKLILANNHIGDAGLYILSDLLGTENSKKNISKSLKVLDISNNDIKSHGLETFSMDMIGNQSLQDLNLSNNYLSEGQRFFNFKYFLTRNWMLKKLCLQNSITFNEDIKHLSEGLQSNRSIHYLNISHTSLDKDSFHAIVNLINKSKSLKTVILDFCNIADSFMGKLSGVKNTSVKNISFESNYISDKGGQILMKFLENNRKLQKVNLKKNCMNLKILRQIELIVCDNQSLNQKQEPDLSYFDYVAEINKNKKELLETTIQKLKQKQKQQYLGKLMVDICQLEDQIGKCKIKVQNEKKEMIKLQQAKILVKQSNKFITQ